MRNALGLPPLSIKAQLRPLDSTQVSIRSYNKSMHTKLSDLKSTSSKCILNDSREIEEKRWPTEAETNDLYEQDFEEESSSFYQREETVPEQIQLEIANESSQKYRSFNSSIINRQQYANSFLNLSISDLNRKNQRLIQKIETLRKIIFVFRRNEEILSEQREELTVLQRGRKKAFDYSYELSLDKQKIQKRNASNSTVQAIRQISGIINKDRFKSVKQSDQLAYPTELQLNKSQISSSRVSSPSMAQLASVREELLSKRRTEQRNKQALINLQAKEGQYKELIRACERLIEQGSGGNLQMGREMARSEIVCRQTYFEVREQCLQQEIRGLRDQIDEVETKIVRNNFQKMGFELKVPKLQQQQAMDTPISIRRLSKQIHTQQTESVNNNEKKVTRKYNYNSVKSRNSQFFRQNESQTRNN